MTIQVVPDEGLGGDQLLVPSFGYPFHRKHLKVFLQQSVPYKFFLLHYLIEFY
jgi:hypothetical protein